MGSGNLILDEMRINTTELKQLNEKLNLLQATMDKIESNTAKV